MTTRAAFTPEEWALLQRAVRETGTTMMAAQPGGRLRESFAMFAGIITAGSTYGDNELIKDILNKSADDMQREDLEIRATGERPYEEARPQLLDLVRKAVTLLEEKATPEEVADFKGLLIDIGSKVANAVSETGGFLGFGGQRVSSTEQALLDDLKATLRL